MGGRGEKMKRKEKKTEEANVYIAPFSLPFDVYPGISCTLGAYLVLWPRELTPGDLAFRMR